MKSACLVVHNYLSQDPRARREAEALLSDGWSLDVVCLRGPGEPKQERWNGATVHRLPVSRHRGAGTAIYMAEYAAFLALAATKIAFLDLRRRYELVQAHNVPDALVFAALAPRLRGARVVLDVRDPLPDLYVSKFGGDERHPVVRAARWVEAASVAFADHVLTPNEPSRQRLLGRGLPADKITNVLNSPDPRLFAPVARAPKPDGAFTLVYHGGLFERYGLDVAVRAVDRLRDRMPGLRLKIAGIGEELENLRALVAELKLDDRVSLPGWIDPEAIREFVADADLGVVPYRQDSFTDLIYPTKAFEYVAMGRPVVMSRLAGVVDLFGEMPDLFVAPGDVDDLAERIWQLHREPARLEALTQALANACRPLSWEGQRRVYLDVVDRLTTAPTMSFRGGAADEESRPSRGHAALVVAGPVEIPRGARPRAKRRARNDIPATPMRAEAA